MGHLAVIRDMGVGMLDEARAFSFRSPRVLLALRPVLSVAMAVTAAHALGLQDTWWAAISAFVVMQEDFGASLYRGVLRIVGTLAGAGIGFVLGPALAGHPVAFVLLMAVAAWGGLFAALVFKHSYAWVLALVTFVMVMCEALNLRADLAGFALERVANIGLGTVACVAVAGLTERRFIAALSWRRRPSPQAGSAASPGPAPPAQSAPPDRRTAALHALHGACAVALLAVFVLLQELSAFPQALVTAIAVLVVPVGANVDEAQESVTNRMVQRFAGCLLAGAIAIALLPLIEQRPLWCQLVLGIGVWLGAYLQAGAASVRYMAVQFSVAFLMVFVQDGGWTVHDGPALLRLGGVFAGIVSLSLVLFASSLIRKAAARSPARHIP
ncbi:FUSC family protein [Variovorax sp. GT1P44]|uniref:FUSC family protein n=1 Tax=Variovorax sp. GT1P44 TaxID=3443742 RepID=UPI003F446740